MSDVFVEYERQARNAHLFDKNILGRTYQGREGQITVSKAGIIGAAHRRGVPGTKLYFEKLKDAGWDSRNIADFTRYDAWVERRLRLMQDIQY
jgi:hypothetical protein